MSDATNRYVPYTYRYPSVFGFLVILVTQKLNNIRIPKGLRDRCEL